MENAKKITALHLANEVAKENIENSLSCPSNASKQLIGRAATKLLRLLHL